jgi:predicted component of type VI protein secretion system
VKVEKDLPALERSLLVTGRICAREDVEALKPNALPGLSLHYQDPPPQKLPLRLGFRYFEIMRERAEDQNLWRGAEQHQNIAVFCDLPAEKTEMQLWGVNDK